MKKIIPFLVLIISFSLISTTVVFTSNPTTPDAIVDHDNPIAATPDMVYVPNLRIATASGAIYFNANTDKLGIVDANTLSITVNGVESARWNSQGQATTSSGGYKLLTGSAGTNTPSVVLNRSGGDTTGVGGASREVSLVADRTGRLVVSDTLATANVPLRLPTIGNAIEFGTGDTKRFESVDNTGITFSVNNK